MLIAYSGVVSARRCFGPHIKKVLARRNSTRQLGKIRFFVPRPFFTEFLALIYFFCFEDTVSLPIPIKRHDFCQTPFYNSGVTRFES